MAKISMNKQKENLTLEEGFELFLKYKKVHNVSPRTIDYYKDCFKYFGQFCDTSTNSLDLCDEDIIDYIEYLQDKGIKDVTINSYLRGIRAILYFLMKKNCMENFKIELVKEELQIHETYTETELQALLKKPNVNECSFAEYRSWAMINFLLGTAVRLSSLTNVKIKDLDLDGGTVTIRRVKNRKQQIIPISEGLCRTIREYLEYRQGMSDDYLFSNQFGKKLAEHSAENAIAKYNRSRGIDKTSIHTFRHTFAKLWIMNGGDIFTLQKILGHSSLYVVKRYVNLYGNDIMLQYSKYNPLDTVLENTQRGKSLKMKK